MNRSTPKEIDDVDEIAELRHQLDPSDPNFKSELNYDGYQTLEELDNDAYGSLDAERSPFSSDPLKIEDREENSEAAEENPVDPQENRK